METEPGAPRLPTWSLVVDTEATELLKRLGAGDDNEAATWVASDYFLRQARQAE